MPICLLCFPVCMSEAAIRQPQASVPPPHLLLALRRLCCLARLLSLLQSKLEVALLGQQAARVLWGMGSTQKANSSMAWKGHTAWQQR